LDEIEKKSKANKGQYDIPSFSLGIDLTPKIQDLQIPLGPLPGVAQLARVYEREHMQKRVHIFVSNKNNEVAQEDNGDDNAVDKVDEGKGNEVQHEDKGVGEEIQQEDRGEGNQQFDMENEVLPTGQGIESPKKKKKQFPLIFQEAPRPERCKCFFEAMDNFVKGLKNLQIKSVDLTVHTIVDIVHAISGFVHVNDGFVRVNIYLVLNDLCNSLASLCMSILTLCTLLKALCVSLHMLNLLHITKDN
ncbi:hypothetical protein V2J09_008400, partial [Rumex salicifolius]